MREIKITPPLGYEIDEEISTDEKIIFKSIKDDFPESWEGLKVINGCYVDNAGCVIGSIYNLFNTTNSNKNVYPTEELAEASLAVAQLSQLRERCRNGWKPDWSDESEDKYCIVFSGLAIGRIISKSTGYFLAFKTHEQLVLFLNLHSELIIKARPILGGV